MEVALDIVMAENQNADRLPQKSASESEVIEVVANEINEKAPMEVSMSTFTIT